MSRFPVSLSLCGWGEGEGDSAHWTKIGAAWQHADGQGLNLTLSVVPLNGRIVVRTVKGEEAQTGQRNGQ